MLLYQTIFNVDAQNKTINDVQDICCQWLYNSRNSKFNTINLTFNFYQDNEIISQNKSEKVISKYIKSENTEVFYFEYIKGLEQSEQWVTTIIINKTGSLFKIGVKLEFISQTPRPDIKYAKKPLIINNLINNLGAAFDGKLQIDEIQLLDNNTYWLDVVADMINGKFDGHLPCLYLSRPLCFNSNQIQELQKELSGLAHIFIEPEENSQNFSYKLKESTDGKNAYHGSIGIYWKGGHSKKLFLNPNDDSKILLDSIKNIVRNSLLLQKFPQELTLHFIQERKFRINIENLKQKVEQAPRDYKELEKLYTEMEKAYEQELTAKNKKIKELEENSQKYFYENLTYKTKQDIDSTISIPCTLTEYFPYEIQHKIYNILIDLPTDNYADRTQEILGDIKNSIKQDSKHLDYSNQLTSLKNILSSYDGVNTKLKKILSYFNIKLTEDGKHIKANFQLDTRYPQSFAKTPSDDRAGKNIFSIFKRILYK